MASRLALTPDIKTVKKAEKIEKCVPRIRCVCYNKARRGQSWRIGLGLIIMSGDHGQDGYDEVNVMKDYAVGQYAGDQHREWREQLARVKDFFIVGGSRRRPIWAIRFLYKKAVM